ncbi:hypothetical protein NA78x_002314 [Anatilimnocola sp. NA78]|uniref:hypothetical protein n=1 Tax=Anatilimnocola sp. NA78 TaxID=3415683 RepID=UPI003CE4EFBB
MQTEVVPAALAKLVAPRAMKNYAKGLGWLPVTDVNGSISVFQSPNSDLHQILIPLDDTFDDFGESVAEVVRKLSEFEGRSQSEILSHLLLPPADVVRFRESSTETETGTLHLDQAVNVLEGVRRTLLSIAHSAIRPQPFHRRLSRIEAEQFVRTCRLGQTERGSFTVTVACPLDVVSGALFVDDPLARQVTHGLLSSLNAVMLATEDGDLDQLLDTSRYPFMSANLCEAILMLRPEGERSRLSISVAWSKALAVPSDSFANQPVELRQDTFEAIEYLAPKLRTAPAPKEQVIVGFVDVLRGQLNSDGQMAGEVVFSIVLDGGDLIRAKAELTAADYHAAGEAHLQHEPVYFRGLLIRGSRVNRIDSVGGFTRLQNTAQ